MSAISKAAQVVLDEVRKLSEPDRNAIIKALMSEQQNDGEDNDDDELEAELVHRAEGVRRGEPTFTLDDLKAKVRKTLEKR